MKGLTSLVIFIGAVLALSLVVLYPVYTLCSPETPDECGDGAPPPQPPPSGGGSTGQCTTTADCVTMGLEGWTCLSGICVQPDYSGSIYTALDGCNVDSKKEGDKWLTAGEQGEEDPCYLDARINLPADYDPACLQTLRASITVDDTGGLCAGYCPGNEFYSGGTRGSIDARSAFISSGLRTLGAWVTDTQPATTLGVTTRSLGADIRGTLLNPTPVQKCELDSGGNPVIVPLCPGTKQSCISPTGSSTFGCVNCGSLDGPVELGSSSSCEGTYRTTVVTVGQFQYDCTRDIIDPTYGNYRTCGGTLIGTTQTTTERELCKFGCTYGNCKFGKPPMITSVKATPDKIGASDTVVVTSVASDPDTVTDGTTTVKEKIKLVC